MSLPPPGPPPGTPVGPPDDPTPLPWPEGPVPEPRYVRRTVTRTALVAALLYLPVAFVLQLGFAALIGGVLGNYGPEWLGGVVFLGPLAFPLVLMIVAIVKMNRARTAIARSRWLGILIGTGIGLIVFGGLCVALIASFSG